MTRDRAFDRVGDILLGVIVGILASHAAPVLFWCADVTAFL